MNVAFIGMGIMGSRMAANLLKNGHTLSVHNRSKDKAMELVERGARWAQTPAQALDGADVVITMLAAPAAVEAVAFQKEGILSEAREGVIWMDCSTVDPAFSKRMAEAADAKQMPFVDAPVAGSRIPAEKGELIFLVGAEAPTVQQCAPLFDAMGSKTVHMGPVGSGAAMKMVINLMLAESMRAFAESVALGTVLGLDREMLMDVLLKTPVCAPVLSAVRPKLDAVDLTPNFPLKHMRKDVHLAMQSAFAHDLPLAGAAVTGELYAQAQRAGFAENDFSALFHHLQPQLRNDR